MGKRTAILHGTGVVGYVAGALALGAMTIVGTVAAPAAETLSLTTVVSVTGGKITSFDISFVDPYTGTYVLGDRTNKGVTVISTTTNPPSYQGTVTGGFKGLATTCASGNVNDCSGPNGVMIVNHREIWAGDGDSTVKILPMTNNGSPAVVVSTGGKYRADEMCFDPIDNIGFVVNNADDPPFMTAISDNRGHAVLGHSYFTTAAGGNGINATDGVEQCQYNPRDGKIYVSIPEINGPGDNSQPGGVARINPVTLAVEKVITVPLASCSGPQGLAIGPVVNGHGQILLGCNGAIAGANAAAAPLTRNTAVIDDGTQGGTFGTVVYTLPYEAGNDEVWYNGCVYPTNFPNFGWYCPTGANGGDGHYYLARGGNNTFNNYNPQQNPTPNGSVSPQFLTCPGTHNANDFINYNNYTNYGGNIYVSQNTLGQSSFGGTIFQPYAGPQVLGMVNATTGKPNADTVTGLANCATTNPGPQSALSPPPPSTGYTLCAAENGTCSFTGTQNVAFGANGKFYYKTNVTSPIACNDATFGDPNVGTVKACYYGPGKPATVASGASNAHGSGHSVAADLVHNYIFVPIPSNNFVTGMPGVCASKGGNDANGCIAVYSTVGKD